MAKGNVNGPLGPIMFALLLGIAAFMVYAANNPEMAGWFDRPTDFYDNSFEKVGYSLLFAIVASALIRIFWRRP
ncbi:hypothetical protein [Aurantiacibacter odishensis]|uniref:hypothetical protein n=1 Tax=Aurantiacibacter odishensis TaxID=1155476 RepID=UPI000E750114|nr:hypothetical protein [Aurantiacibacter odishensis]